MWKSLIVALVALGIGSLVYLRPPTAVELDFPVIDVNALRLDDRSAQGQLQKQAIAEQIRRACTTHGFFFISGHGFTPQEREEVMNASRAFFDLDKSTKAAMPIRVRAYLLALPELITRSRAAFRAATL